MYGRSWVQRFIGSISFNSTLFLFSGSSEMNWHLLIMLESALKASPSNHHLKLLLMKVYCSMGE